MSNSMMDRIKEPQRTEYREGAVLSASALLNDSATSVAAWQRHQRVAHTGGIVAGLHVSVKLSAPAPTQQSGGSAFQVQVSPGMAIDFDGRMILVDRQLSEILVDPSVTNVVRLKSSVKKSGAGDDLDRYQEVPNLEVAALENLDDIAANNRNNADSVVLGFVRPVASQNKPSFVIDFSCRRYIGAVGGRIDAASGRASILLGPQTPGDTRRFAVAAQTVPDESPVDVITWEQTGTIHLKARSSITTPSERPIPFRDQPALLIAGATRSRIDATDILDPCAAWRSLCVKKLNGEILTDHNGHVVIHPGIRKGLSFVECVELESPPACPERLRLLIVAILNRLIRNSADLSSGARGYVPIVGDIVGNAQYDEFTVADIDGTHKTCDLDENDTGSTLFGISWSDIDPLYWCQPVLIASVPQRGRERLKQYQSCWHGIDGAFLCRYLIDEILGDAIIPSSVNRQRGLFFNGNIAVDREPSTCETRLVEFKKDGQKYRQLRIAIPDPGKDNHPNRYRCSIGFADCTDPAVPAPSSDIWNEQTSWPRGILSVLANRSVDIHSSLNIFSTGVSPGLVIKLKPDDQQNAGTVGGSTSQSGSAAPPPASILGNVIAWENLTVTRRAAGGGTELIFGGTLHNVSAFDVGSLLVLASIYGKQDTTNPPRHFQIIASQTLKSGSSALASSLQVPPGNPLPVPHEFDSENIIVSLLVTGVNQNNAIIVTQYQVTP